MSAAGQSGLTSAARTRRDEPLLRVRDLVVHLNSPRGIVRAVDGVALELQPGQMVGIVGESGSGKSVLCRSLLGLTPPSATSRLTGSVQLAGQELVGRPEDFLRTVRGRRIAMIFQDPMTALSPVMKVWRQIAAPMRKHLGVDRRTARRHAVDLLEQVGIADPGRRAEEYPVQMSGGMRQRVMIAVALSAEPDVLVADEPTTALDVTVQAQILDLIDTLRRERDLGVVLVTHDISVVGAHADEIKVMYAGRVVESGPAHAVLEHPRMQYTGALMTAVPDMYQRQGRLATIGGSPPDLTAPPRGCPFHPRCAAAVDRCRQADPALVPDRPGHLYACWNPITPTVPGHERQR